MKLSDLLKQLEGTHTLVSLMSRLEVSKPKTIYFIRRLRKAGYVKTFRLANKMRVYSISFENRLGGTTYEDVLNKESPVKIATDTPFFIYGKQPSFEEVLIYAVKKKSLRTLLAALVLFKKLIDWTEMHRLAKANHCERQIGALYDVARLVMRTRRMSGQYRKASLPKDHYEFRYFIEGLRSKDFKKIEDRWKVHIPFNKADLEPYDIH